MMYAKTAWMVVNRRGSPSTKGGVYGLKIFRSKKLAEAYAGNQEDVVRVTLSYWWEWLPK